MKVGVLALPGLVGVDAADVGEALVDAAGELLADAVADAAGELLLPDVDTPAEAAAAAPERLLVEEDIAAAAAASKGALTRVSCSVIPRGGFPRCCCCCC